MIIVNKLGASMDIKFIKYDKRYSRNFYELNIEWLEKYFDVEDYDRSVLGNPEELIINKGGVILFAKLENDIVGTVALMPTKEKKVYELSKMAVMPKFRNKKIGQKILNEIICISKQMKLNKLILYSNRKLKNAINLYLKYGFKEVRLESTCHYKRADIKMSLSI
jgi:N-acetylglutamate synthase-like GNAT family acetyltransferase